MLGFRSAAACLLGAALVFAAATEAFARDVNEYYRDIRIIAYGDDFTAGYGIEQEDAWPRILRDKLNEDFTQDRINIINAGVIGDTAASGAARISSILSEKPNVAILAFGMHDALLGIDPSLTYKSLEQMLNILTYNNIYVMLVGFKAPQTMELSKAVRYNAMFPELADRYKVTYVPYMLKDVEDVWYNLQYDKIHPSEEGHEQIANNLFKPVGTMITKIRDKIKFQKHH